MDTTTEGIVMDISKLTNVRYTEQFSAHRTACVPIHAPSGLNEVVWELATRNPTWNFYVVAGESVALGRFRAKQFDVRVDDQVVGTLYHMFYRREPHIGIGNERIGKELDHGNIMRTKDVRKALQLARKYFGKLTVAEQFETAEKNTKNILNNIVFQHERTVRDLSEPINRAAREYVHGEGLSMFREYLANSSSRSDGAVLLRTLDKLFEARETNKVVTDLVERYKQLQTCTVVLNGGTYIVKHPSEGIVSFNDTELPDYVRNKIGLLKLIKAGELVGGMGFRVNEDTFVIVIDKEATC